MKKNENKTNSSYLDSKNLENNEKDKNTNSTIIIKRKDKRHKTEMGIVPKNLQLLINKNRLANKKEEENINKILFNNNNNNIQNNNDDINMYKLRKNKSSLRLQSSYKYNINIDPDIKDKKDNIAEKNSKNILSKSKSLVVTKNNIDINTYRRNANIPKYERRLSDKFINNKKKKEQNPTKKDESKQNDMSKKNLVKEQENHYVRTSARRKTVGVGLQIFNKQENQIKYDFTRITHIKSCNATSEPGMDDGHKKINQDSYILEKNIKGVLNFNIFGVLDGHGDNGHLASNFVKRYLINKINNHHLIKNLDNTKDIYKVFTNNNYQILTNIFLDADNQIKKEKFNCEMSGTTCVLVIQLDEHLICANVGDSRAILIYDDTPNNNMKNTKIFLLSHDHKPENQEEKERIISAGGEVDRMVDENYVPQGPYRVWVKEKQYPGLAMSRSIGDMDAKTVGVIPNPQFVEYTINKKSKYMVIGSDGVYEFISNEEIMAIGNIYYSRNDPFGLCNFLTKKSTELWLKEDSSYIDDITIVAVFF